MQKVGVDIKDVEKGSEGCPAAKQVAERTASPGSNGGGSKDLESLARSGWPTDNTETQSWSGWGRVARPCQDWEEVTLS